MKKSAPPDKILATLMRLITLCWLKANDQNDQRSFEMIINSSNQDEVELVWQTVWYHLEYSDSPERVEMYVQSNLCLEFLGQLVKHWLFMQRLTAVPLIVEPVDDVFLEVVTHLVTVPWFTRHTTQPLRSTGGSGLYLSDFHWGVTLSCRPGCYPP